MRILGIELKGNDTNLCIMEYKDDLFTLPDCRARKFSLRKNPSTDEIRKFHTDFIKLAEDYKVTHVMIKERPVSGKFSGGPVGFKMETAIQLATDLNVELISPAHMKLIIGRNPLFVSFRETGLKAFQQAAFEIAFAGLMKHEYGIPEPEQPKE